MDDNLISKGLAQSILALQLHKEYIFPLFLVAAFVQNLNEFKENRSIFILVKKDNLIIVGISAYFHDSAVAIIVNGQILFAAEEERYSRIKHDPGFPKKALKEGLGFVGINAEQIDHFVFYEKPFLKFERIIENSVNAAPKGFGQFAKAIPQWLKSKLNLRKTLQKELCAALDYKVRKDQILFDYHHISHAASAFYPSGFKEATFVIIDGVGEWATKTIGKFSYKNGVEVLDQENYPNSLGLIYSAFTYFLGFKVNNGEYKMMGLSPYGDEQSEEYNRFIEIIENELVEHSDDGRIELNMQYFSFHFSKKMLNTKKWETLFGIARRNPADTIDQSHANLALAIQRFTEKVYTRTIHHAYELNPSNNLVLAGGVAYNSVANGHLLEEEHFKNFWIQPAAGDSGGALGAALHYSQMRANLNKLADIGFNNGFLGNRINDRFLLHLIDPSVFEIVETSRREICERIAQLIAEDEIIGLAQDRLEFGPRALGARSIIANPKNIATKAIINSEIKKREDFRPFAPVMLLEESEKYFGLKNPVPFMQVVKKIKDQYRLERPDNYESLSIAQKSKVASSIFGAITHVDYSARLQVINDQQHPFYDILVAVKKSTGVGVLLNTSFNSAGQPIVNTIEHIYEIFTTTPIKAILVNETLIVKKN
jgi:carbamoyltransferase